MKTVEILHGFTRNMGNGGTYIDSVEISESLWAVLSEKERQTIVDKCAIINRPAYSDCWAYVRPGTEK